LATEKEVLAMTSASPETNVCIAGEPFLYHSGQPDARIHRSTSWNSRQGGFDGGGLVYWLSLPNCAPSNR
jgi:hypothetical protein